ncbi:MAG: hypothetical protein GXZ11_06320, partial [Tissierellia bacterium]|nr:hypothetical protein [Tissierellia bacterium]
ESSMELDVIWSTEEYNGELPGEQEFIGSYNLPEDIVGDKPEVKITIKVLEKEKPTVVSVEQPLPIEVEYGTAIENIALPKKIIAKLSNESSMELDVIWSTEEYNGELPGEQEFIGSYNLPEDVVGDKPEVKIIIKVSEDEEHNTANVTFMWMQPGMDNVIVKADIKGRVIPPEINFLDGYRFAGWYRNINYFGDEIDFKSEVFISDTVVYAKWIKIESEKPVIEEPESQGGFWLLFSGIGQSSTSGGDNKPEQELSVTERVKDINGHWAEFAIRAVVRKGLMDVEKDEFKPNVATSRMEIIMGLAKLNKVELNINTGKVFKDIKENSAEAAAIQWAVNSNIVDGYEDGTFHPNKAVSREEMAKILVLYVEHVKHEVEFEASPGFNDEDSVGDWAKEYVKKSREMKLLMGREDGSFDPSATLTKGEVAQLIYRLMK